SVSAVSLVYTFTTYMYAVTYYTTLFRSTGDETRDFTFVTDIVNGVLRCGYLNSAVGESINLASGRETKIVDLARLVNRLTGNTEGVVFHEKRDWDESTRRRASIDKSEKILNFRPSADMERGVGLTVKW